MHSDKTAQQLTSSRDEKGLLLGIILDLSDSMRASIVNKDRGRTSRIENFAKTISQVLQDADLFLDTTEPQIPVRLFIHGFGFVAEEEQTWQSALGDVLTVLTAFNTQITHYQPLQSELERLWLTEIHSLLKREHISGDAEMELREAVEKELRRHPGKFVKPWYASLLHPIHYLSHACETTLLWAKQQRHRFRSQIRQGERYRTLYLYIMLALLAVTHSAALFFSRRLMRLEIWIDGAWERFRDRVTNNLEAQAEKVVTVTKDIFDEHREEIILAIRQGMTHFIDQEAFKFIHLYDAHCSQAELQAAFDRKTFRAIYQDVTVNISRIMKPHASTVWEQSTSTQFLKKAAAILQIKPNYNLLRKKTERCARQVIWEMVRPRVQQTAERLANERFKRAVLISTTQRIKDRETTLSLQELSQLIKQQQGMAIKREELPIFGESPMGHALAQTFLRLRNEIEFPQNKGLRPAILLISDGLPTDMSQVDDKDPIDSLALAAHIKQEGIPIICGLISDKNIGSPRILQQPLAWLCSMGIYAFCVYIVSVFSALISSLVHAYLFLAKSYTLAKQQFQTLSLLFSLSSFVRSFALLSQRIKAMRFRFAPLSPVTTRSRLMKRLFTGHAIVDALPLIKEGRMIRERLQAAHLLYNIASSVDEWPLMGKQFEGGFKVQRHAKLFLQVNHTTYLRELIEDILLPIEEEAQMMEHPNETFR